MIRGPEGHRTSPWHHRQRRLTTKRTHSRGPLVCIWSARGCETEQTNASHCEPEFLSPQWLYRVSQAHQGALHRFPKPGVAGSNSAEGAERPRTPLGDLRVMDGRHSDRGLVLRDAERVRCLRGVAVRERQRVMNGGSRVGSQRTWTSADGHGLGGKQNLAVQG